MAVVVWVGVLLGVRVSGRWLPVGLGVAVGVWLLAVGAERVRGRYARVAPRTLGALAEVAMLVALGLAAAARGVGHEAVLGVRRGAIVVDAPGARTPTLYRIAGTLVDPPLRESGMPSSTVRVDSSVPPLVPGSRVRLWLPAGCRADWGDRVVAWVRLEPPGPVRDPGGPASASAASAAGLVAWGRAFTCAIVDSGGLARATACRWRRAIEDAFAARLSPAAREIVTPLVTGDRSALGTELDAAFRAAGVVHLLALSGLHVTWMAGVARGACAALGLGVAARAAAGAACALGYGAIAGPLPSLARAVLTECCVAGAALGGLALDPVQALALSALAALALAPGWARDLGFQLSCVATLGLLALGPAVAGRAGRARPLVDLFAPTACAQVSSLPLLLARMHAISWVSPLTNLLAVPVSGFLLAAAWLAAAWELALPGTARLAFAACEAFGWALRAITEAGARLPGALIATGSEPATAWTAAMAAVLLMLGLTPARPERRGPAPPWRTASAVLGAACGVAALVLAWSAPELRPPPGRAWLVTLDVAQGDAIALATPAGWWLVDTGARSPHSDAGERVVLPFLRWAGIRTLEGVVLTHDDADHVGGAPAVRRGVRVRQWIAPPSRADAPGPGPRFGARAVTRGDVLAASPALRVLWPPDSVRTLTGASDNGTGVALELDVGGTRALLLADLDTTAEQGLALRPAAVLKLGHHGSRTSTSAALLAATHPQLAIVSCGRWNHFGHPHQEVLARLAAAGIAVRRTDAEGAIWLELDRDGVRDRDWRSHAAGLRQAPHDPPPRARPPSS